MKRLLAALVLVTAFNMSQADIPTASFQDVLVLVERGVSDETILAFLATRRVGFILDVDAIDLLLVSGVSEEVIRYLLLAAATSADSIPDPTRPYVDALPADYVARYYAGSGLITRRSAYPRIWLGHSVVVGHGVKRQRNHQFNDRIRHRKFTGNHMVSHLEPRPGHHVQAGSGAKGVSAHHVSRLGSSHRFAGAHIFGSRMSHSRARAGGHSRTHGRGHSGSGHRGRGHSGGGRGH